MKIKLKAGLWTGKDRKLDDLNQGQTDWNLSAVNCLGFITMTRHYQ